MGRRTAGLVCPRVRRPLEILPRGLSGATSMAWLALYHSASNRSEAAIRATNSGSATGRSAVLPHVVVQVV